MPQNVSISNRDLALLRLIDMTPATATQIRKASATFTDEPFRDERRVRERVQALVAAGLVRNYPAGMRGGGLMSYYRLAPEGHRVLHPQSTAGPSKPSMSELAPSRLNHALATADVIVHTLVACHAAQVRVLKFHGDGRLSLEAGEYRAQPDCHFQMELGDRVFNVLFEIDNATEPLDSPREQSIRTKLLGYEAYQDWVLRGWRERSVGEPRPGFRVLFLTRGAERAYHILWLARKSARNPDRRLVYATTQDAYLAEPLAVTTPIVSDHNGHWVSLVDVHPSAPFLRAPVRLTPPLARRGVL